MSMGTLLLALILLEKPGVLEAKPITAHAHSEPGATLGLGYLGELVDRPAPWRSGLRLRGEFLALANFRGRFGVALTYGYLPPFRLREIQRERAQTSRHSVSVLAIYRPGIFDGGGRLTGYVGLGQQLELWRWRTFGSNQLQPNGRLLAEGGILVNLSERWHLQANVQGALSYVPLGFSACAAENSECAAESEQTLLQPFRVRVAVELGVVVLFGGVGYH